MRQPFLAALFGLVLLPAAETTPAPAPEQPAPPANLPEQPPLAEESPLVIAMGDLKSSLRPLKRAIDTDTLPANAAELVALARAAAVICRKHPPAHVGALPNGEEKDQQVAEYQRQMDAVIATIDELAAAVAAQDVARAATHLATLKTQEQAGHEQFRKDE